MTRSCTNSPPDYFCVLEVSMHINRRNMVLCRKRGDLLSVVSDKWIRRTKRALSRSRVMEAKAFTKSLGARTSSEWVVTYRPCRSFGRLDIECIASI